ncbi:hypothetical protein [Sphingobacterium suaedae]|uniref:FAS1 domain-containing protein n=1 Tax=Sphingobacterium suaedae TaxID=1686402 RepID=A0ABW5KKN7_9SPHI
MKKLVNIVSIFISLCLIISCERGDQHYYEYTNETQTYDGTILQYIESRPGTFDSLVLVLDRLPELRKTLGTESGELTLFAVTNRSFEIAVKAMNVARGLSQKSPLYLEDIDKLELDSLVSRYVFTEKFDTEELQPFREGRTVKSARFNYDMNLLYKITDASGLIEGGQQQILLSDVNNSIFQRYWKTINTAAVNLKTKNGVIHVLSSGHDFGFNKLTTKFSQ